MEIKKGDNVVVIAGKEKGKRGKVLETSPKTQRVVVEGVNVVSKHKKPRSAQDKGGIIKQTNPIDSSNVMVVCPTCDKATRISHKLVDGKKARVCKKCGASLDKEHVKAVKKDSKAVKAEGKAEKNAAATEAKPKAAKAPAAKAKTTKTATKPAAKTTKKSEEKLNKEENNG